MELLEFHNLRQFHGFLDLTQDIFFLVPRAGYTIVVKKSILKKVQVLQFLLSIKKCLFHPVIYPN